MIQWEKKVNRPFSYHETLSGSWILVSHRHTARSAPGPVIHRQTVAQLQWLPGLVSVVSPWRHVPWSMTHNISHYKNTIKSYCLACRILHECFRFVYLAETFQSYIKQVCIPIGCVSPTSVAATRRQSGGLRPEKGLCPGGVSLYS